MKWKFKNYVIMCTYFDGISFCICSFKATRYSGGMVATTLKLATK
jgi:hypothetical protein